MRALSVFPAGFTGDAARRVLGDGDPADVPSVLEHLVDQSLLQVADTPTGARFRMLETVREFATAHREAAGETGRVVGRFLARARQAATHADRSAYADAVSEYADLGGEELRAAALAALEARERADGG